MTQSEIVATLTSTRRGANRSAAAKIGLFTVILAAAIPFLAGAAPAATSSVSIANFAYAPPSVSIAAGTTVVWTNNDAAPHSVTGDGGTFDSSPSNCSPSVTSGCLAKGGTFSHTFSTPGTFTYFCRVHTFMHGTIVVTTASTTTTSTTRPISTTTSTTRLTTTTRPGSTTTAGGSTTTVASTTSSVAPATTSIASTTVAATSTSVTIAASHSGGSSASLILIVLGLLAVGAVVVALYRRRGLR